MKTPEQRLRTYSARRVKLDVAYWIMWGCMCVSLALFGFLPTLIAFPTPFVVIVAWTAINDYQLYRAAADVFDIQMDRIELKIASQLGYSHEDSSARQE